MADTPEPLIDSILNDIKYQIGISETETHFDKTIIMDINTAIGFLTDMGVGPALGYSVKSKDDTWANFLGANIYEPVKTYIHLKTKLLFDPPANTALLASIERLLSEAEWRITNHDNSTSTTPA